MPSSNPACSDLGPIAAFALWAEAYFNVGLLPFPVDVESKRPLVRGWEAGRPRAALDRWLKRSDFANAGVAAPTGRKTNLVVIDLDDASLLDSALDRFGATPWRVATPGRKGIHLGYKYSGEKSVIGLKGEKIDVCSDGRMIVLPPSYRRDRDANYSFIDRPSDLGVLKAELPRISPGALPQAAESEIRRPYSLERLDWRAAAETIPVGQRNDHLFLLLLRQMSQCGSEAEAIRRAEGIARNYREPLSSDEIQKIARSVWKIQTEGRNWAGSRGYVSIDNDIIDTLKTIQNGPDALFLLAILKQNHGARPLPFAVSPKAMHKAGVIPGWGIDRIRNARNGLTSAGELILAHSGGQHTGDPNLYRLRLRGGAADPILTKHLPLGALPQPAPAGSPLWPMGDSDGHERSPPEDRRGSNLRVLPTCIPGDRTRDAEPSVSDDTRSARERLNAAVRQAGLWEALMTFPDHNLLEETFQRASEAEAAEPGTGLVELVGRIKEMAPLLPMQQPTQTTGKVA